MQGRTWPFVREGVSITERLLETSRDEGVDQRVAFSDSRDSSTYVDIEHRIHRAPLYMTRHVARLESLSRLRATTRVTQ